jgi:hypothetical protein
MAGNFSAESKPTAETPAIEASKYNIAIVSI